MALLTWARTQWDRSLAIGALIVGLISLLIGWIGVSSTPYVSKQLPYIVSGGLLGVCLVGAAAAIWISADLRDEWRELRGLRLMLREEFESPRLENGFIAAPAVSTSVDAAVELSKQH
ncbi:hypothetical protein GCM10009547_45310 [Sporichthya brevicatena]|uniref:Uncharacterized protein n=1 Tax=Sporichthya brevicatena TaxID=171442 RepID=A0ABN1HAV4_9ACTN